MEIKENSLDALCLFSLYICIQDRVLSKSEITELFGNLPRLCEHYFHLYGEFSSFHLDEVLRLLNDYLIPSEKFATSKISTFEISFFDALITEQRIKHKAIQIAEDAASKDGLHRLEKSKLNYWKKRWQQDSDTIRKKI